jgi:Tol biopolymer transport system component
MKKRLGSLVLVVACVLSVPTSAAAQSPSPAAHPGDGIPDPAGRIAFGRIVGIDDFYGLVVALYAIDPDGSDLVQLTDGESVAPVWSPDGTRIAFTQRQPDGTWQVATMAADGSDLRVLTTGEGVSEASSWSPDSTWIAYSYAPELPVDDNWHTSLYRMSADGSDPALMGDPEAFDVEPQISPDGSQLTFTRLTMDDTGWHGRLLVRDIDSGEERVIDAAGDSVEHPEWSPDGEWIMYAIHPSLGAAVPQAQAERIRADGSGEPEILVAATADQRGVKPSYSPDGGRIAG